MDLISLIAYLLLLLFALAYASVIVYHIVRYRVELPAHQSRYVSSVMIFYIAAGVVLLTGSILITILLAL